MSSALNRYLEAANGLTTLTKSRAEQLVRQVVKQGEAAADQAGDMVEDLLDRSKKNRETLVALVRSETQRVINKMGLASATEVERLEKQVNQLKRDLAAASTTPKTSASAKKKSTAKKSSAKKSTAKKSSAKKSTAKKKKASS